MSEQGTFSEDGLWWWDGHEWRPAVSEDGLWKWDGVDWIASSTPPSKLLPDPHTSTLGGRTGLRDVLRRVPGFRTGKPWKEVLAFLFYLACLIGLLGGLVTGQWSLVGWSLSLLSIAVLTAHLVRLRQLKPLNMVLICGLVLSVVTCGVSFASLPGQITGNRRDVAPVTPTPTEQTAANNSTSTPAPTVPSTPTPTPTPTPTQTPPSTPAPHAALASIPEAPHISPPAPPPVQKPPPPPPQTPLAAACYPLTNAGNCYEPGQFCRKSDHGKTGVAGNGTPIICRNDDGWRWEPM